jgi:hypothetical protein
LMRLCRPLHRHPKRCDCKFDGPAQQTGYIWRGGRSNLWPFAAPPGAVPPYRPPQASWFAKPPTAQTETETARPPSLFANRQCSP